ncbi:anaerobic ribonucleoside triphosphate reductase [Ethanoligenens harbinense]|uniref:Anaerobic ribonucleoside-triphosphate reductase n=1 Tax=Ethanoligenens harbinense (strain DSM 18485 / JCM 12961 / CGMCC 1.5033 / YUAN-3) TaxID=663278 RepID=E6U5X2_ETHHY|nr:anaerobic ribonucleoside triphosphate reductase [Ethanoligenens harbinense]ADU27989.1 anaerobic ribonucleoside-triphosphate reductase [Ethanoligenens harbinense YUAN-3]AVQ97012.1 anaerobic ribonucleoside-triphosphate reductase [Ethanoligenens harbinense YUAN-3]AYF39673.1 anaerobic ribonucleoside-triphosphate reductase [Ethanoligenens harbinense]AYF42504.1 anaerobic ribonucleoside-triphosphate reductase [Ethanoligenens harbinense]QCN93254.1 anaerobic ribonucleoside triphosphate reductase [Et
MITRIRKRDGREAPFNMEKIANAIYKAARANGGHDYDMAVALAEKVTEEIQRRSGDSIPTVEGIQDIVEHVLIETGHARTAKAYILYRANRTRVRDMNTRLMKIYEELTFKSSLDNDLKRENANIDGDTAMGTMLKYGSEGAKQFYDMFVLKPEHAKAHREGDIHIHDLDFLTLTTTCCQIDLVKLFENGFCTGHGFLREPNDINSYTALACIAIQSNQNDQHGGQSVPNFDYAMAIGVRKTYARRYRQNMARALELIAEDANAEKTVAAVAALLDEQGILPVLANNNAYQTRESALLQKTYAEDIVRRAQAFTLRRAYEETDRATYQAMEAFIHNLNTMHSRAGAQIPFSSINYGMDTTPEGRMAVRNVLLATEAGLGNGETPIFPIQIFRVKEGVSYEQGDPNYDLFRLACRVSAKRMFPNFSFIDAPFNLQYYKEGHPETEMAYMGCRTRVGGNYVDPTHEIINSRGNLSFTSVNLPRIALRSHGDVDAFFEELDRKIELVIDQLLDRFEIQGRKKVRNFPFLMGQGIWLGSEKLGPDDEVREVLKHGTLTLGFIGLAECLKALIGEHHGESERAQNLGLEIVGHMRKRMDEATVRHNLNFSLIATPAEGLSGRFVRMDKERFGIIEGVTDRDYYTNSFHVPVYYPISAFQKIQLEGPYHELTNGGHITYIELDGDPTKNLDAFEAVVRCMKENNIGYGAINHPVDRDPVCGFTGIIGDRCPKCGRAEDDEHPFERIRRITGYLVGTLDRFNNAKRAEEHDRVKHLDCNEKVRQMENL